MKQINEILGNLNIVASESKQIRKTKKNIKVEIKNELVVQHNALTEARYKLSLQEKRVILWLLTRIKPTDEDFKLHRLEITEFSKMTGLEVDNQYSKLQEVTLSLMKRVLKIHKVQTKSILQIAWLSYAEYHLTKGYIELRFDPALKPYLLQLKSHFTKLSIGDMMQLTSTYAIRFYELLKQYETIGKREISIKDLREYCGIAEKEYKKYNDFKKDVLERAKKEINEKTDIVIDYKELKQSRKIAAIEWIIKKKDPHKEEQLALFSKQQEFRCKESLIQAITRYGFGRTTARQFLNNYKEEDIKNALRAIDLQIERNHVKNPKAMLKIAIQEQWHPEVFKINKKR
jgi:plasmid replication initiation protein